MKKLINRLDKIAYFTWEYFMVALATALIVVLCFVCFIGVIKLLTGAL